MKHRCTLVAEAGKERERERQRAGTFRTQDRIEKQETIDALSASKGDDLSGAQKIRSPLVFFSSVFFLSLFGERLRFLANLMADRFRFDCPSFIREGSHVSSSCP